MRNRELIRLRFDTRMSADDNEAEIMVYGDICGDDWKWSQSDVSATDFDKALKQVKGKERVNLRINSPGGEVFQAVAMRAMLVNAGIRALHIYIEGLCASAATLLTCIPNATVHIAEGSEYMIHNPRTYAAGEAADLEHVANWLRGMESDFRSIYAKRCGKAEDQIKSWMDTEKWFTAKEAVEAGFADEIMEAMPVAASVSPRAMTVMRGLYKNVPDTLNVAEEPTTPQQISNEAPFAAVGSSTEHKNDEEEKPDMDNKDMTNITMEELRANNEALYRSIMQAGEHAERERIQEIDDLTPAGYEQMAAEAKENGTSAMDFHKAVVKAQREKGEQFLAQRKKETAEAAEVLGGSSDDAFAKGAEKEIAGAAKEIAEYAKSVRATDGGGMY